MITPLKMTFRALLLLAVITVSGSFTALPSHAATASKAKPTTSVASPAVKKSINNLCHAKGTKYYAQTKKFKAYLTIKDCLKSGGKMPKGN